MAGRLALQTARRAESDQLTHDEPEIGRPGMNQETFEDVLVAAEMRAAHASRVVDVRERSFDILATSPHQSAAPGSANPSAIAIHRRLGFRRLRPIASTAGRLRDVGPE